MIAVVVFLQPGLCGGRPRRQPHFLPQDAGPLSEFPHKDDRPNFPLLFFLPARRLKASAPTTVKMVSVTAIADG